MTTEQRIARFAGNAQPATYWLVRQVDEIEHFLDTVAYRNGSPEFRKAILAERAALIEAWREANDKEKYA